MRGILIDPSERSIGKVELPDFVAEIRGVFGGARLTRIATMPTGDRVHLIVVDQDNTNTFSLGGSGPHRGLGLILGRRGLYGMVMNSRTDLDGLTAILSFGTADREHSRHGEDGHRGQAAF